MSQEIIILPTDFEDSCTISLTGCLDDNNSIGYDSVGTSTPVMLETDDDDGTLEHYSVCSGMLNCSKNLIFRPSDSAHN